MTRRLTQIMLFIFFLTQVVGAVPEVYASIGKIRGRIVAVDTKTGFMINGYTIEYDDSVDKKALAKIRRTLISNTRCDYRKFKRPRRNQTLVLVRRDGKVKVKVGDYVEVQGYAIIGHSDNDGSKDGFPYFTSFKKVKPNKK